MRAPTLPPRGGTDTNTFSAGSAVAPVDMPSHGRPEVRWLNVFESVTVTFLALLVTALHVRFATNVGGLWRDEANSVNLATLPSFAEMWRVLDFDSFPMLFFAVLRGWTANIRSK